MCADAVVGLAFSTARSAHIEIVDALARFREAPFDLVVTDLTMPFATGLEVARECRTLRPTTPILLMTGFNPTLQANELRAQGIVGILLKPYGSQELGEAVATALAAKVGV